LPADGVAFFVESDEAVVGVEVVGSEGEGAAAAAGGSGVQADEQGVEFGVAAGGGRDVVDLCEPVVGDGVPGAR
jgi:hypothetical protein